MIIKLNAFILSTGKQISQNKHCLVLLCNSNPNCTQGASLLRAHGRIHFARMDCLDFVASGRRGWWWKLVKTTFLALCVAVCLRFLLRGSTIERLLTPAHRRLAGVDDARAPLDELTANDKLHDALDVFPADDRSNNVFHEIFLEDKEDSVKELGETEDKDEIGTEGDIAEVDDKHQSVEQKQECPYKDSALDRYKCFLPTEMTTKGSSFDLNLQKRANKDNVVFLVSVDNGYVDMAMNLYETSFQKLGLTNFLFVCSDSQSAVELATLNIDCFVFEQNIATDEASIYMSKDFIAKTHVKTKIILSALYLGYKILITDADIVLFKNPLLYLNCTTCDIEIQSDHIEDNSGFYLARPTTGAILLHQRMLDIANSSSKTSNQKALKRALKSMTKKNLIKVGHMDKALFPCGIYYFEKASRMWEEDNVCHECVMVHNNWIVGKQAKVLRFKDHLLWSLDTHGYYSDPNRKYLLYDNPTDWGDKSRDIEVATLKRALQMGHVLNRTVILPGFTCRGCNADACKTPTNQCSLNTHLRVSVFHEKFSGLYREHKFLLHPKVPKTVKESVSPPIQIIQDTDAVNTTAKKQDLENIETFRSQNANQRASEQEIRKWFGPETKFAKYSVLQFASLYNAFETLDSADPQYKPFMEKINSGFKKAGYRQY